MGTGTDMESVLSGFLTLDVVVGEDGTAALENVKILPLVKHHNADGSGYQITELSKYAPEMAAAHGVEGLTVDAMQSAVSGIIPADNFENTNG